MTQVPSPGAGAVTLDFIADVICPWCYVGRRNLAAGVSLRPQIHVTSVWRAYQLYPGVPAAGMDRAAFMLARFGPDDGRLRAMRETLETAAAAAGIALRLERAGRIPNTLDCHRLIGWAQGQGVGDAMIDILFRGYFEDGADLTHTEVLADLAAEAGLERSIVLGLLASDADSARVVAECDLASRLGVTGVPAYVLNGRFMVVGAQPPDVLARALDRAAHQPAD